MARTESDWSRILQHCGCSPGKSATWARTFAATIDDTTFSSGEHELPDFLGQIIHESAMLGRLEENLNYTTPERIMQVWPSRFASVKAAEPYVRNPTALANLVYFGRNGNKEKDDGFRYAGKGLLQITGRANYQAVSKAIGIDLIASPELLAQPETALLASIAWWEGHIPDSIMGDIRKVTRAVNGGQVGLEDRLALTNRAAEALAS